MITITSRPIETLKPLIENAFERMSDPYFTLSKEEEFALEEVMGLIDRGKVRVAEPINDTWVTFC